MLPEEFTDSDLDFVVRLCDGVVEAWNPVEGLPVILNLPQTVERRLPNEYADLIEEFIRKQKYSGKTIISVHNHNDMGCAVAATMQCLLAGAQRVEGTLFGHGERTGNVDLTTVALNLEYLGINTGLNFSNLPQISKAVEDITSIAVQPRHPYAGELVFTAFSGSHQDAIHKGLARKDEVTKHYHGWKVPYLHIDPSTIGRVYERFIRINSQSGKGGVAHVMQTDYHIKLPRWIQVDLAQHVQAHADKAAKEISSQEVWDIFLKTYVTHDHPIKLINYWPRPSEADPVIIEGELHVLYNDEKLILRSKGNGPISAVVRALRSIDSLPKFILRDYAEETMGMSADAEAICFIKIGLRDTKQSRIGVGINNNIDQAAVRAVLSGLNALLGANS
ncbi:alpha-isopropylmalate synthase regulatory domain-containing protein [Reichenbachiella sp.]|uniref:alpha-isopropylmalate synthase regulatory domain-containing protein n=1 Tax=Reichenbachiella sp. TaxID=2184521 RepID=UPI003B59D21D